MKKIFNKKYLIIFLSLFIIVGVISPSFADTSTPPTLLSAADLFHTIINAFVAIAVVVFFFMLVVGGFRFITAGGDKEKLEAGKKGLIFSILGFALVFLPYIGIPAITKIAGVNNGVSVSDNGNLKVNIGSTFTATPLPSNLINTMTPPPYCGPDISDCVPKISQLKIPGYTANYKQYNDTYSIDDYGGYTCGEASIVEVFDAYVAHKAGITDAGKIWQSLEYMKKQGYFDFEKGTFLNEFDIADSANYMSLKNNLGIKWQSSYILDYNSARNILVNKIPLIVHLSSYGVKHDEAHFIVATKVDGNRVYVADPANISADYYTEDTFKSFSPDLFWILKPNE